MFVPYPYFFAALLFISCKGGADRNDSADSGTANCGNNIVEPALGEQCDTTVELGTTCNSLGFSMGEIKCSACQIDTSGCEPLESCGNGTLDTIEICEGFELRGKTCQSEGFIGGMLTCTDNCTHDSSDCFEPSSEHLSEYCNSTTTPCPERTGLRCEILSDKDDWGMCVLPCSTPGTVDVCGPDNGFLGSNTVVCAEEWLHCIIQCDVDEQDCGEGQYCARNSLSSSDGSCFPFDS